MICQGVTFKFEGRQADKHLISALNLGRSLIGIDRLSNAGLVFFDTGRNPKQRERSNVQVFASTPSAGSVDLITFIANAPFVLPIAKDFITSGGSKILFHFSGYVLSKFSGRGGDAEKYLEALTKINRDNNEFKLKSEAQWQGAFISMVERLVSPARSIVSPVGMEASKLTLTDETSRMSLTVDEPMADAIRSADDVTITDEENIEVLVDGIIHHSKQLKIVHPNQNGRYITAEIRDPMFDIVPNKYSEAASMKGSLKVVARSMLKGGELLKLYIMRLQVG